MSEIDTRTFRTVCKSELSQHKILRLCIEASYKTRHASLSHVESPKRDQTRFSVL
jgi:hypothetical protein